MAWFTGRRPSWSSLVSLTVWVRLADMSRAERVANPGCEAAGGFSRARSLREAYREAWVETSDEGKAATRDWLVAVAAEVGCAVAEIAETFEAITGIAVG